MRVRGIHISDHYTGMCNQMIQFLHGVIQCVCDGIDVIVVNEFKTDLEGDKYCPFGEVIDLEHFSSYLFEQYGVIVIDKIRLKIRVKNVMYGTMTSFVNATDAFHEKHVFRDRVVVDRDACLNLLAGDPAQNAHKSLRITYLIDDRIELLKTYCEESKEIHLSLNETVFHRYEDWPKQREWMNTLLRVLRFHRSYSPPALILPAEPVHVVHVRLEYDAIKHWASENDMTPVAFYDQLAMKYISALSRHASTGRILVLSHNSDNRVVEWLKETKRPFLFVEKDKTNGRERNAVSDMVLALAYGNGVFIGNFDIYRMQGSTFSYFLMKKGRFKKHVLIDIERIHQDAFISIPE